MVGVGVPTQFSFAARQGGVLSTRDLSELSNLGAVGDISLRYFDAHGRAVVSSLDGRIIGLEREQIRRIPCVIGVAGGMAKLAAVRGALRGHLLNVLVTDIYVARRINEEVERGQL